MRQPERRYAAIHRCTDRNGRILPLQRKPCLYCPPGGYAEDFCLKCGYTYAYTDAPSVLIGGEEKDAPWILEHPDLQGSSIGHDRMNLTVYWVQVRLKATGRWYQGDEWDCTGNRGSHTMSEITAFTRSAAGFDHDGTVDDTVIGMLMDVPDAPEVLVGGFYDCLNTLNGGDRYGDMTRIDKSASRDAIIWVQTCLKQLGFYTSTIDGKFGSGTPSRAAFLPEKIRLGGTGSRILWSCAGSSGTLCCFRRRPK